LKKIGKFCARNGAAAGQKLVTIAAPCFQDERQYFRRGNFGRAKLSVTLKCILSRIDVDASRIKLEVTEGLLLQSHDNPVEILNEIKSMGIGVAMDDFGTGYSSLLNLRQFFF
jgi:hypothetical protein